MLLQNMPTDDIQKTIYKLELDDSAYTAGVNRLVASTEKLTSSQQEANIELGGLVNRYKQIQKLPATLPVIKIPPGTIEEIKKITNTIETLQAKIAAKKEFLITETDLGKIKKYNQEIQQLTIEAQRLKNIGKQGFDEIGNSTAKATAGVNYLSKGFGFFRQAAYLIPGIGLAGIFNLIGVAVSKLVVTLFDAKDASEKFALAQQSLNSAYKSTEYLKAIESVQRLTIDIDLAKKGFLSKKDVLQEYNKELGESIGKANDLDTAEQLLVKNGQAYIQVTLLKAAANIALNDAAKIAVDLALKAQDPDSRTLAVTLRKTDAEQKFGKEIRASAEYQRLSRQELDAFNASISNRTKETVRLSDAVEGQTQRYFDQQVLLKAGGKQAEKGEALKEIAANFQKNAAVLAGQFNIDFFGFKDPKAKVSPKAKKALEDDFEKRKADFLAQISALAAVEFETEVTIRRQYADKLAKALLDIKKDKSITGNEKDQLNALAGQLNDAELTKALKAFNKKVTEARERLNDELNNLQDKNNQDQLNLIQDEFDRRARLIAFNEAKQIEDSKDFTSKKLKALDFERLLIGEKAYEDAREILVAEGEIAVNNIIAKYAKERKDLSADLFKASLDNFQFIINQANISSDEDTAKKVREQSDRFLAGKITFEQFQKELTKIQKKGESDRRNSDLQDERTELSVLQTGIDAITDKKSKEYADLIKLRDDFKKKIASDEKEDAIKDAGDGNDKTASGRAAKIIKYAEAISSVADSIIQFWAKANEAETKALDRSITLQEKRVEAAQRIASRGNAQYLKQEEDRLRELNVKRENAARKQLGIDAALQASQILVAITGAIAKIANPVPGAGIAETIGAIAVIIGSLATGYGLVKSLQGNQPKLAKGDKYVSRGNNPGGVDTIPAWLNEGEAVIPTHINKAYHPAVSAIYDGTIPADHMNNFVNAYHRVKGVPMPNYSRIGEAAGMSISADGKMAILLSDNNKKLDESNELSRQTLRAMKSMNVSANIDRDGVAIMVNEFIGKMNIDKRV